VDQHRNHTSSLLTEQGLSNYITSAVRDFQVSLQRKKDPRIAVREFQVNLQWRLNLINCAAGCFQVSLQWRKDSQTASTVPS
jgi:hypothetical protein